MLLVLLGMLTIQMLSACGSNDTDTTAAVKADVVTMADHGIITTWDPRASVSSESRVLANLYEPLILANPPGSAEPFAPCLATAWEVSADGKEWTFELREGVTFHDGEPFNAAAVKSSIYATKELGLGNSYVWGCLESIEVIDDYTVKFITKTPTPLDYLVSAEYAAWMFSPKSADQPAEWWNEPNEAGTGPYMLESYKPNEEIVLVRNPDYWGGWKDNQFQKVVYQTVKDSTVGRQMLEAGDVDIQWLVSRDSVPAMKQNPDIHVAEWPTLESQIIYLNVLHEPLDDLKVRQALAYATPYEDIIQAALNGFATQSNGPIPAGLWPRNDDLQPYTYDLEKAKHLMAEAGYADGGIKLDITYPTEESYDTTFMSLLKESWAQIGVELDLKPMLWAQAWERAKGPDEKRQDLCSITWWPAYSHGYDSMKAQSHSEDDVIFNLSYWSNPEFDQLIDTAWTTEPLDRDKAKAMYDEAQALLMEQVPIIYVWDFKGLMAWNQKIKVAPMGVSQPYPNVIRFYYVTL